MRIISKFHDYYDAAQAEGQDLTRPFIRTTLTFPQSKNASGVPVALQTFAAFGRDFCPGSFELNKRKGYLRIHIQFGLVLFAGKLYPYALLNRQRSATFSFDEPAYFYSFEALAVALEELACDLTKRDPRAFSWSRPGRLNIEEFFKLTASAWSQRDALEEGLAIASYSLEGDLVQAGSRLSPLQFYKALNAWQAFQELSMFFGNLAAPERIPVIIEEKYRIAQHGFDRWSFRKAPEKMGR